MALTGGAIKSLRCVAAIEWSQAFGKMEGFFRELFGGPDSQIDAIQIHQFMSEMEKRGASKIATMFWEVAQNEIIYPINSVAIFDNNGEAIFDSELANLFAKITIVEGLKMKLSERRLGYHSVTVKQKIWRYIDRYWPLPDGGENLNWQLDATLEVDEYIKEGLDNYIRVEFKLSTWSTDVVGWPEIGDRVAWLGFDGEYDDLRVPYFTKPWTSLLLMDAPDKFDDTTIEFDADDGITDWDPGKAFLEQKGITFLEFPENWGLSLVDNIIHFENTLSRGTNRVFGTLYNESSIIIDKFKIKPQFGGDEDGYVQLYSNVKFGFMSWPIFFQYGSQFDMDFFLYAFYVRAHEIPYPKVEAKAYDLDNKERYQYGVGDTVKVVVSIENQSREVSLISNGSTSIRIKVNDSNICSIIGSSIISLADPIIASSTREYEFRIYAKAAGDCRPEAILTPGRWGPPAVGDGWGNEIPFDQAVFTIIGTTTVDDAAVTSVPQDYQLYQNFPNPFNPETKIRFQLPEAGKVILRVFNMLGNEVSTLLEEEVPAGHHAINWNGRDNLGNPVPSGIYIVKFESGEYSEIKKMSLLK